MCVWVVERESEERNAPNIHHLCIESAFRFQRTQRELAGQPIPIDPEMHSLSEEEEEAASSQTIESI